MHVVCADNKLLSHLHIFKQRDLSYPSDVKALRISEKNRQHNGQKKKIQKDKQRSTKHTHKTKY